MYTIVILHESIPPEPSRDAEDVYVQAEAVSKTLSEMGHTPHHLLFDLNLKNMRAQLVRHHPDIVFNLVESVAGSGALIHMAPAILESVNLPYTGARTDTMFLTSNKLLAKSFLKAQGILTPYWVTMETINQNMLPLDVPYIIKSVWEHASIGLSNNSVIIPHSQEQLYEEMKYRQKDVNGNTCFAELYIDGREFSLSLLESEEGIEVLPIAEMRFLDYPEEKWKILDYTSKWETDSFEYSHTKRSFYMADQDSLLFEKMYALARKCWTVFGMRGYGRIDFRVDTFQRPWVLEINTNPCIAPDSGFVAAAQEAGLSFHHVIERIIRASLNVSFADA
ncbi:MAG: D-alanine--D-alanine ligase family protein [bacterium]